jgi:UDP-N-acetylmuramate dehydrogenase
MHIHIEHNKSLRPFNTFGVEVTAKRYIAFHDLHDLNACFAGTGMDEGPLLILGGGSNILFTGDFDGCVMHVCAKGIEVVEEDHDKVYVRVQAGEVWDDFVDFCIFHGYGGVENLVAIPGSVGAAPVQNIGAYGAEVKDVLSEVEVVFLSDGTRGVFTSGECNFGYRSSIFKNELKGKVVITSVVFRLPKHPVIHAGYGDVQKQLDSEGLTQPTIRDVARVIRNIRDSKLPDPKVTGNAGSFFKNPVVDHAIADSIKADYPEMPYFPQPGGGVKLAAGWLVEQSGLKGFRLGRAAVHDRQALVLVNTGGATGEEILALARYVIGKVDERFGVGLEPEVNIL